MRTFPYGLRPVALLLLLQASCGINQASDLEAVADGQGSASSSLLPGASGHAQQAGTRPEANTEPATVVSNAGTANANATPAASSPEPTSSVPASTKPPAVSTTNIDDLLIYSLNNTHSDATPMGIHYEALAKKTITSTQKNWLLTPSSQPRIPSSTSGLSWKKFVVTLYPSTRPVPSDVNQHGIGNCSSAAVMASLAYVNPAFLQQIITDTKNGTYKVKMYDPTGTEIAIAVDNAFLADSRGVLQAVSGKNYTATWATVIEKATLKYLQVYPVVDDIGGIGSEYVSPMFTGTGDSVGFYPKSLTALQMMRAAKVSLATSHLVVGGFNAVTTLGSFKTVTNHAWTIMVPPSSGDVLLAMRNPWGVLSTTEDSYDGSTDGVLEVPQAGGIREMVDMRIMAAGAAAGSGVSTPYTPAAAALK